MAFDQLRTFPEPQLHRQSTLESWLGSTILDTVTMSVCDRDKYRQQTHLRANKSEDEETENRLNT
jgi:hypothetical protein